MVQPGKAPAIEIARFRAGIAGYLAAMVVQFWLGMWVNLFVEIPNHPAPNPPEYFSGVVRNVWWSITQGPSLWLTAHALFGLILVAGAFGLLARAIALRSRLLIIAMSFGAFGVLAAGFNGGSFSTITRISARC